MHSYSGTPGYKAIQKGCWAVWGLGIRGVEVCGLLIGYECGTRDRKSNKLCICKDRAMGKQTREGQNERTVAETVIAEQEVRETRGEAVFVEIIDLAVQAKRGRSSEAIQLIPCIFSLDQWTRSSPGLVPDDRRPSNIEISIVNKVFQIWVKAAGLAKTFT